MKCRAQEFRFVVTCAVTCASFFLWEIGGVWAVSAAEFGEKPLTAEKQEELDALILRLGDPSSKVREQTKQQILELGSAAIETLQKACRHSDFTVSESARYCLRFLNQDLIRSDDSPEVREILTTYQQVPVSHRFVAIYELTQLPQDVALRPLLRLVFHEKDPLSARFAALGVLWNLPCEPTSSWLVVVPEDRPFPNPESWARRAEATRQQRQAFLSRIRTYLASETQFSVGRQFLEELLELEKELTRLQALPESQLELRNHDFEAAFSKLQVLKDRLLQETQTSAAPEAFQFYREFLCFTSDLLGQTGFEKESQKFWNGELTANACSLRFCAFNSIEARLPAIIYRFHLIQLLASRGHREWCVQEIQLLSTEMQPTEKAKLQPYFTNLLRSCGEFAAALAFSKEMRRFFFLKGDDEDSETEELLASQILYFQALDACVRKDYAAAKKVLEKHLTGKEQVDVDALILARKIAVFTKDESWLAEVEKRVEQELDASAQKIQEMEKNHELSGKAAANQLNQFAWLAANTQRRLEEALDFCRQALKIVPDTPGVTDTLAAVYFAKGDYETAFRTQLKAVQLDPLELELQQNLERIRVYLPDSASDSK